MGTTFMGRVYPSWVDGKKTYIMAAAIVAVGTAQAFGIHIPEWILWILGAGGVAAHRAAVSEVANDVLDTKYTVMTILDTMSAPATNTKGT